MSADGKISTKDRRQVKISGSEDRRRVDALRADSDAIMVGVGTVLADDPSLRIKLEGLRRERLKAGKKENPLRVVADSRARTPPEAQVLGEDCLLAVSEIAPEDRVAALSNRAQVVVCGHDRVDLPKLLDLVFAMGVRRLMVEGGGSINWSLISSGLVDEVYVFIGPMVFGGKSAPTLVDGQGFGPNFVNLELISCQKMDGGILLRWRLPRPCPDG
jgi:2,5-diamino-6-(ribosylamino)-4(3H)-pyrimidinone 5'-phosphate reductase